MTIVTQETYRLRLRCSTTGQFGYQKYSAGTVPDLTPDMELQSIRLNKQQPLPAPRHQPPIKKDACIERLERLLPALVGSETFSFVQVAGQNAEMAGADSLNFQFPAATRHSTEHTATHGRNLVDFRRFLRWRHDHHVVKAGLLVAVSPSPRFVLRPGCITSCLTAGRC